MSTDFPWLALCNIRAGLWESGGWGGPFMKYVWAYVWAIVENIATVWIAYYVFSKVSARFEVVVVALLLSTYSTIRAGQEYSIKARAEAFIWVSRLQILTLKRLGTLDDEIGRLEREVAELLRKSKDILPADIIMLAMGVVILLCLYHLLTL
jgi:hypothetical protein